MPVKAERDAKAEPRAPDESKFAWVADVEKGLVAVGVVAEMGDPRAAGAVEEHNGLAENLASSRPGLAKAPAVPRVSVSKASGSSGASKVRSA